ncbi:MAG: GTP-binding protein [Phycisphaerae bacterium]|nr:GTP-binding protein [Phycisphaerae bacterium]
MAAFAAVMTGSSAAAIATVQLVGESAEAILSDVFCCSGQGPPACETGRILLGHIIDGADVIDQVTVGCEGPHAFTIHCHGNPLIVERIMKLLQGRGVELLDAESLLAKMVSEEQPDDSIAVEAKLVMTRVKTLEGARIIGAQMAGGLSQTVRRWSRESDSMSLAEIADQARQILRDSRTARRIVEGCKVALVGPPNTGKSTLLNALAGCEKAIVTDIEGTTRDWVCAEILIPPLAATVIDTAGFGADAVAAGDDGIEQAAQARSVEIVRRADLVVLVLDLSRPEAQVDERLLEALADKRILTVLNKCDLPAHLDLATLPAGLGEPVRISAKQAIGIDDLIHALHWTLGVADFDPRTPVAFTTRQHAFLKRLAFAETRLDVPAILAEILRGPIQT